VQVPRIQASSAPVVAEVARRAAVVVHEHAARNPLERRRRAQLEQPPGAVAEPAQIALVGQHPQLHHRVVGRVGRAEHHGTL